MLCEVCGASFQKPAHLKQHMLGHSIESFRKSELNVAHIIQPFARKPIFLIILALAVGIVITALWGLGPLVRQSRNIFYTKTIVVGKKRSTYLFTTSYVQPLLLWIGAVFICSIGSDDLQTEAGEIVKERLSNFVSALSDLKEKLLGSCCQCPLDVNNWGALEHYRVVPMSWLSS